MDVEPLLLTYMAKGSSKITGEIYANKNAINGVVMQLFTTIPRLCNSFNQILQDQSFSNYRNYIYNNHNVVIPAIDPKTGDTYGDERLYE